MKTITKVKDVQSGSIRVMIIQHGHKKKKDGWLFYPSMAASMRAVAIIGLTGSLFTAAGMAVGGGCLVWWGILAAANAKATRWGSE